jgi:hypothetical protein
MIEELRKLLITGDLVHGISNGRAAPGMGPVAPRDARMGRRLRPGWG